MKVCNYDVITNFRNYVTTLPVEQLEAAEFVCVCRGPVGGPFTQQYEGPYEVVDRNSKVFRIKCGYRVESVSADRL
jgi:hypothetical protein